MLFNFQLRALSEVSPWGNAGKRSLHWFGLTDGWYWLQVNEGNELFRYSPELMAHWARLSPKQAVSSLPYVDYYVVRLWEDVLELLADILEPLPPRLAYMLETGMRIDQWLKLVALGKQEIELDDELWETFVQATSWWECRQLNTGYLTAAPHIWFWNAGEHIHCFWDNRDRIVDDLPVWQAQRGEIQFTPAQFLEEVRSFHTRLFLAMEQRVQEAKRSWPHPGVALDIDALEKEQQDRALWLEKALSRPPTPWDTTLDAITILEKRFV